MGDNMFGKAHDKGSRNTNERQNKREGDSDLALTKNLQNNISLFENIFSGDEMLVTRRFQSRYLPEAKCCVIYFDDMVNSETINENVIQPVLSCNLEYKIDHCNLLEELLNKVLIVNDITMEDNLDSITNSVLYGDTIFLLEGYEKALIIDSKGWQTRAITEPETSRAVRGPREGFTESIRVNISLVRRKINNPDLKFKFREIGEKTRTKVCISYIEGLAVNDILKELERRLDEIKIDAILDSGYIQELIRDAPFSPFETVGYNERPDGVAAKLLEGRIAVLVDGSPIVLTVPYILAEAAQASEDYYNNYVFASFNRLMRTTGAILAIAVPSLYLAVVTYHQEMLPTPLLLSISVGREGVPFPTFLSLIIMLYIFDILREAGTRMPAPIGQAINIVGTLILGQAAVEAKLVSPHVIIITAFSGIVSLLNMTLLSTIIVLRFYLLLSTSILGVYGFLFGSIIILLHVMNIRSFGVPFMMNMSTVMEHNFQDAWIRAPWWEMTLRPKIIGIRNIVRQSKQKRGK
jgi:spore germination protein KA